MNKNEKEKTQVFNVIILDKSGSMSSIREAAVSGFNETLAGIRKAQETYADTQTHYVSLVAFCSCEMKEIYDKAPVTEARPLEMADYQPCCCTPLYDAMGFTLTKMQKYVQDVNDALVVVTIITDGLENASKEYTGAAVKSLVEQLKEKGWCQPGCGGGGFHAVNPQRPQFRLFSLRGKDGDGQGPFHPHESLQKSPRLPCDEYERGDIGSRHGPELLRNGERSFRRRGREIIFFVSLPRFRSGGIPAA